MTTLLSAPDRLGIPTRAPCPSRAGMETVRSPLLDFSRAQWCAASPSGGVCHERERKLAVLYQRWE